jgi:integrase
LSKATSFEEYRRLKNKASRRIIPIAPQLIELGFLDFVRERQEAVGRHPGLLFLGLTWQPKSGYGRRPSEHTLDLLKAAEVWERRRKVGHSLRASCTQELQRVGMSGELLDRYLGHSTRTVREKNYNEGALGPAYPVRIALEYLRKMDFGVRFPTYAEIKEKRVEWARQQQLARKNGYARRQQGAALDPGTVSRDQSTSEEA